MSIDYGTQVIGFDGSYHFLLLSATANQQSLQAQLPGKCQAKRQTAFYTAQHPNQCYMPANAAGQHRLKQSRWTADLDNVVDPSTVRELPYTHAPFRIGTVVDQRVSAKLLHALKLFVAG